MDVGLRWLPVWSSSPVKDSAPKVSGESNSPFHRMIWELFSISLWDKATILGTSDPNRPSVPLVCGHLSQSIWSGPLGTFNRCIAILIFR
ncbi:hypothetical protein H6P81_021179 [Aristolochia fimbriata]|uniref:Uncharacterized protein n=1 Tax=Aristolochia fimbriata TaxID=158543 RepID=A0AAV7DTM3_ARIFI|nr:hypothetical protein H6P81_021179 [Aristolochia fimbriata]